MQIYLISGRLVVAKDAADARAQTGVAYKASVMNLTPKLKALCQQVLGDDVFGGERTVSVQALRREEEEHAHTRRLLEEQSARYRDLFDRHQKLSNEMIVANGRISALTKDSAQMITGLNDLLAQARQGADHLNDRAEKAEAELVEARAEIERLLKAQVATTSPAEAHAEATKRFLSGEDISAAPETPGQPEPAPTESVTPPLSPISQKHGKAVMQLLDLGHNPDEVVQEINARLPLNDHITTGLVKKIKVEMTQHLRALNQATLKAKRA